MAVVRDDAISMEVDAVVHRISDSTMAEDKRSALDELRGMVQDNPKVNSYAGTKKMKSKLEDLGCCSVLGGGFIAKTYNQPIKLL